MMELILAILISFLGLNLDTTQMCYYMDSQTFNPVLENGLPIITEYSVYSVDHEIDMALTISFNFASNEMYLYNEATEEFRVIPVESIDCFINNQGWFIRIYKRTVPSGKDYFSFAVDGEKLRVIIMDDNNPTDVLRFVLEPITELAH
jgi:hypothetical protein